VLKKMAILLGILLIIAVSLFSQNEKKEIYGVFGFDYPYFV